MRNNKTASFLSLACCWSVFSFATVIPNQFIFTKQWVATIVLLGILNCFVVSLVFNSKVPKPLTMCLLIGVFIFNFAKAMYALGKYVEVFHSRNISITLFITTGIILIYLVNFYDSHFAQGAVPLFCGIVLMILLVLLLNISKASAVNIYSHNPKYSINLYDITFFDWIIPVSIILKEKGEKAKPHVYKTIFLICGVFIVVAIMQGLCIRGNSLYSLSPLQALFQISTSKLIKRYTYIYTLLLYMGYFASLMITVSAFNHLKLQLGRGNSLLFLALVPLFYIIGYIDVKMFWLVQLAAVVVTVFGSKEVKTIGKKN